MRSFFIAAFVFVAMTAAAFAGAMKLQNAYAYPTMGNLQIGAAFITVTATAGDALVGASSPVAGRVELHEHTMENGVMMMRKVESIALPANQAVSLKPGGLHMMLFDLKQPLKAGDKFPVELVFQKAGKVTVQVTVQARS